MNYTELFQSLMMQLGYKPTAKQIAEIIGVETNTIYVRSQRPKQKFSLEEMLKIEQAFGVKLVNNPLVMHDISLIVPADRELSVYPIQYWEGCADCSDLLKRDGFTDLKIDIELINSWNVKPEDLRIIAMPGEEMNGGEMPIRNKDLLVIDTSRNNIVESGVFFCTTHGNSRVYVRRIIEKMTDDVYCVTTVDNLRYKSIIEKKWTEEMWKQADVQVIGRVITNATYTI